MTARSVRLVHPAPIPHDADEFEAKAAAAVARARAWLPSLDPAVFDCYLGEITREIEPTSEADPVAILATLTSITGVHLGKAPHVTAGDDRHPLLVWPLIIGHTNTGKKGASWSASKRIISSTDSGFAAANIKSGLSSGEGLAEQFAVEDEPDPDEPPRDLRLVAYENEWGGVMAKMRREGNSLSQILRAAWEGGDLSTLTVKARMAPESHVGIVAHITPDEFRAKLSDADMAGGTYNRFLPLAVGWSKALPDSAGADPGLVCSLAARLAERLDQGGRLDRLGFAEDATPLWRQLYLEFNTDAYHPKVAQFVSRALPYCKRIAGIHAALDGAAAIHTTHLQAAAGLVRYSIDSARALFVDTSTPSKLVAWIAQAGEQGRSRKEITRDFFGGNTDRTDIGGILDQLTHADKITRSNRRPEGGKGRSIEIYTAATPPHELNELTN
ncbi:uncharacterized protein DUF3987 [Tamaricihabitans halophyticus]|uniref:Uncharacterized protein DUF3987 n=1 Tax=Tamaricihabitans halophyticus TaxID=1262583 RepID=A0A4R2R5E4_9PSEU|nr:DUF3987 domain-containing protein [Tamaricihabitans halophyticus]TCP56968.1 uncharacterized protein DUF3987 [Tamaricihabitans halophyticus]